jgi:hypothetical protein
MDAFVISACSGALWSAHAPTQVEGDGPRKKRDASVNRPLHLTRHEAAGQNIDALEEPDSSNEHEYDANDV